MLRSFPDDAARDLSGRLFLVAGAAGEAGFALIREFLEAGSRLVVTWNSDLERLALEALLQPFGDAAMLWPMDGQDLESVEAVMRRLWSEFEVISGMIQVVGDTATTQTAPLPAQFLSEMSARDLGAALLLTHSGIPVLQSGSGGTLLFVSARVAVPGTETSKASEAFSQLETGVSALVMELLPALEGTNIRVNCVLPGEVLNTRATRAALPEQDPANWPHPLDVARAVHFLASPNGDTLTGKVVSLRRPS